MWVETDDTDFFCKEVTYCSNDKNNNDDKKKYLQHKAEAVFI